MGDAEARPVVLVTGFGPFGHHRVNASWEAVSLLETLHKEKPELPIVLVTEQLPVEYDFVETEVPRLWTKHEPQLVIHVGVSSVASSVTLEAQAHRSGYKQIDNCGRLPSSGCNNLCETECLSTDLDLGAISQAVTQKEGLPVCVSKDAGRYLCEFSYFSSLSQDTGRALFVHVPELDKPHSALELARALKGVIGEIIARTTLTGAPKSKISMEKSEINVEKDVHDNTVN